MDGSGLKTRIRIGEKPGSIRIRIRNTANLPLCIQRCDTLRGILSRSRANSVVEVMNSDFLYLDPHSQQFRSGDTVL